MSTTFENISPDLIWEVTRTQNAFLTKRKQSGGMQFSRDPLNLLNKHSRKYAGYVNPQAIGIQADSNTVKMITNVASKGHKPASMYAYTTNPPPRPTTAGCSRTASGPRRPRAWSS